MAPRVAAHYNVRLLLPGPEAGLRDAVARLRVPTHQLGALARHGSVEAIAIAGLTPEQIATLQGVVGEAGGVVLADREGSRAVVLAPLLAAGNLPAQLSPYPHTASLAAAIGQTLMSRGGSAPLRAGGTVLGFGRTLIMGIINVTPDSFSGDGVGTDVAAAVNRGLAQADAGADIIDVGGESTRPHSTPVPADEELHRVLPVVAGLRARVPVPLSIDTRKAAVAAAAIESGAVIVNDVWGLRGDPDMAGVVATHPDAALVAMHNQHGVEYTDLMEAVTAALRESLAIAAEAGIAAERVVVDPGFGFGKTPAQNLELMRRLGELRSLGRPVLVGPSRKSTIGLLGSGAEPDQRLEGSLALATLAVAAGASIVRVHDVAATAAALRVADAVVRGTPEHIGALPAPGPTG